MPSQATSEALTATLLAALWVSMGRSDVFGSAGPGCDNGKLHLDRDLSEDVVYWNCSMSVRPGSPQILPSIDTVFDPEPARQLCMGESISYNQPIPNSGAYRPVRAESGEYVYCPPQRWLNNLHHAATVLLYHPCAPVHERLLLSVLARSCLSDFIITPHPQLNKHTPIALVSWGRTLELSSLASSDVCGWLETTTSTANRFGAASQSRKYNLLLTWSAEQRAHSAKMKEPLRRCCEHTISSLLNGTTELESNEGKESLKQMKEARKSRKMRAAIGVTQDKDENKRENTTHEAFFVSNQTDRSSSNVTDLSHTGTRRPPADPPLPDPPGPKEAASQDINQGFTSRSNIPQTPGSQKSRLALQTAAQQLGAERTAPPAGSDVLSDGAKGEHNLRARPVAPSLSSKDQGTHISQSQQRLSDKHSAARGTTKDNEVVDVKERELEPTDLRSQHKSGKTPVDSVSKPQLSPQTDSHLPGSHDCGGCKAGEECDCSKDPQDRDAAVSKGLQRTPRTDEAVWAAAALGFLLVLLTLSVLHTRLYRHWRTTPSLYWHDPQQDYDSVADVIRRRLRIAKRRRKRGRRQECVLLPSSSSSDEHP